MRVEIRVGTTSYQGNSVTEGLDTRVERTVREVLKERGMQPADGAGDVTLEVIVAPHADEGYSSNVVARKDGAEIQGTRREQLICELCTEGELLEQLRGTIAELIEPMETAGRQSEEAPPPPPPEETPYETTVERPPPPPPQKGSLTGLEKAGIATFVIGTVAVGAGAGIMVNGSRNNKDATVPGAVVAGIGGALAVTGAVLFIVEQVRESKRAKEPRTAVAPAVGVGTVGLSWSGRF
ncbi:MAG: hypothetical protein R3A51_14540 [Nannocystaceae bacterium]